MLSERNTNFYAQSNKIGLEIAERDIVLTFVLKILSQEDSKQPVLYELAFKGGTCLRKIYFGKATRFSMDLDFTSCGVRPDVLRNRLKKLLNQREHYGIAFTIEDEFGGRSGNNSSYGAVIQYKHEWNSSNMELNISFRETPSLQLQRLDLNEELYFRYCGFAPFPVLCMQKDELIAEKLRAASQRIRSRDLYDLYVYAGKPYYKAAVRILTVVKHWNVRDPFDPNRFLDRVRNGEYDWSDLKRLVRPGSLPPEKTLIDRVVSSFQFLKDIDGDLMTLNDDAKAHRRSDLAASLIGGLLA